MKLPESWQQKSGLFSAGVCGESIVVDSHWIFVILRNRNSIAHILASGLRLQERLPLVD
jgi:hypothetical protein